MGEEEREQQSEQSSEVRDETMDDLDVLDEQAEDVKGGGRDQGVTTLAVGEEG